MLRRLWRSLRLNEWKAAACLERKELRRGMHFGMETSGSRDKKAKMH
jgi:hypothetical protein